MGAQGGWRASSTAGGTAGHVPGRDLSCCFADTARQQQCRAMDVDMHQASRGRTHSRCRSLMVVMSLQV
jgi:hypothetical protein